MQKFSKLIKQNLTFSTLKQVFIAFLLVIILLNLFWGLRSFYQKTQETFEGAHQSDIVEIDNLIEKINNKIKDFDKIVVNLNNLQTDLDKMAQ